MAELELKLSEPISAVITAAAGVFSSIMAYQTKVRETASPAAKDEQDHIQAQMYWDWRALLHSLGIVGDAMPWPTSPKQP